MIKPKELRIGNLLNWEAEHDNAGISKVMSIDRDHYGIMSPNAWARSGDSKINISPIPLTPEWLERSGFKNKPGEPLWEGPQIELENETGFFDLKQHDDGSFRLMGSEWPMGKPFKYVHQLQNLYHSLTGEELTVKETV